MNKEYSDAKALRSLIVGMREAFKAGENAMEYARNRLGAETDGNSIAATLIAYDLQAGSYVSFAKRDPEFNSAWCKQLASILELLVEPESTILEVGVGEATTLSGVLQNLRHPANKAFGFDISWSRIDVARDWLSHHNQSANLFVADLFKIPLQDSSIDVVYTSHSLEPNGGREQAAIAECLRVARKAVVLVEPIYELASEKAQARMELHGYVQGLSITAASLGATVTKCELLEFTANELNPSGQLVLMKKESSLDPKDQGSNTMWRCPVSNAQLHEADEYFVSEAVGIAYPKLKGIPLIRPEHAILASRLTR